MTDLTAPTITSPRLRGEVGSRGCRVRGKLPADLRGCAVAKMPLSPQAGRGDIPPLCSTNALLRIFANLRNVVLGWQQVATPRAMMPQVIEKFGGCRGTRTLDPLIKSRCC